MNMIIKKLSLCLLLAALPANYLAAMQQEVAAAPQFEFHMPITSLTYLAARQAAELDKKTLQATIAKLYEKQSFLCKGKIKNYLTQLIDHNQQLMLDEQRELKQLTSQTISLAATDATPHYAPRHYPLCWTDELSKLLSIMLTTKVKTIFDLVDSKPFGIDEKKINYAMHTNDTQLLSLALPKISKKDGEARRNPQAKKTPISIEAFYWLAKKAIPSLHQAPDKSDTPGSCAITAIEYLLAHARHIPHHLLDYLLFDATETPETAHFANLLIYGGTIAHGNYHYIIEGGTRYFNCRWKDFPLHQTIMRGSLDAQEREKRAANDFDYPAYLRQYIADSSPLGLIETNNIELDAHKRDEWWRAAEHDRFTAVKKFLNEHKEYDVNQGDYYSWRTPLHLAATYGNVELVQLLKEHNADMQKQDFSGRTPLHLVAARHYDDTEMLSLFVKNGVAIDARDSSNMTPLHYAVLSGCTENVAWLIQNGANINAKGERGWTPLHLATTRKDPTKILSCLLQNGASVHAKDKGGNTPLRIAATYDQSESARVLLATEEFSIDELRTALNHFNLSPTTHRIIKNALKNKLDQMSLAYRTR